MASRTYGDPCGIARALDRIGERWALLVVRELLLGPRRFTDLRTGLPEASPNVLSQRLGELENAGVVARRVLPPPGVATVYELTAWGHGLRPVILALGTWGRHATPVAKGELSASALVLALEVTFDPAGADGVRGHLGLTIDDEPFAVVVGRKQLAIERGISTQPAAEITGTSAAVRAAAFGRAEPKQLVRDGRLRLAGDDALALRFLGMFRSPVA